jgi:hypothetical protein
MLPDHLAVHGPVNIFDLNPHGAGFKTAPDVPRKTNRLEFH